MIGNTKTTPPVKAICLNCNKQISRDHYSLSPGYCTESKEEYEQLIGPRIKAELEAKATQAKDWITRRWEELDELAEQIKKRDTKLLNEDPCPLCHYSEWDD